jgi:hypothetical protein
VEGEVVAEELTVGGVVKGSIRANRVKLTGTAVVEGGFDDPSKRAFSSTNNDRWIMSPSFIDTVEARSSPSI